MGQVISGIDQTAKLPRELKVDSSGRLEVVDQGGGSSGDATAANQVIIANKQDVSAGKQDTMITSLAAIKAAVEIIDNIVDTESSEANVDTLVKTGSTWVTLLNEQRLDNDPTTADSSMQDVTGWSGIWVLIEIDSTGSPTNIRVKAQFSPDNGSNWYDYLEGKWASMYWEDVDTASGIKQVFSLPLAGIDHVRFVATATGTDANNYFDVTIKERVYRGAVATAYA